jgi:photosystem II stability/assembly factor-like uncharacterized protein
LTGTGAQALPLNTYVSNFVFDPKDPNTFWVGCWDGKGLFKTTDAGKTFQQLGTQTRIEGVCVDFADPARKTIVIGRHEAARSVELSTDAGATWTPIGKNLPADTNFSSTPLLIGPSTILTNASGWGKAPNTGIWRSEDAGKTWAKVSDLVPTGTPTLTSKGTAFYPVKGGLARSTDAGKTWTLLKSPTAGTVIELPDGRLAGKGNSWQTPRILTSNNNGDTWTALGPNLPVKPSDGGPSLVYLPGLKAFMICANGYNKKRSDAVWRLDVP